jgi:membrane protease YdiL (CAAX protease family)
MLSYITTYGLLLLYYCLFFKTVRTGFKRSSGQLEDILSGKGEPGILFTRLIAGIFLLGIGTVTLSVKENIDATIFIPKYSEYAVSIWILITAAIIIGFLSACKKVYPVTNSHHSLPLALPLSYVLIRILFMIAYEFFFRGMMLFIMVEDFGSTAAVVINLILYTLIHWFGKKERYGAVPMGIILCSVSLYYYSVWPAIIIHLSLALSHEITLLINNKSLIKKSWS